MATQNATALPDLDMSTSVPIQQQAPVDQSSALPDLDLSTSVPINKATSTTPDQPGIISRGVEGVKQFAKPILDLVRPPETPTELVLHHASGGTGAALAAYRIAKGVVDSADNLIKSGPAKFQQAKDDFAQTVDDFHNQKYRDMVVDALNASQDVTPAIVPGGGGLATREENEGLRKGGNFVTPFVRDALTAGTVALGVKNPFSEAAAAERAAAGAAATPEEAATAAAKRATVGKITQAVGPDVETAAKALKSVDTTAVKTFQDLDTTLDNQIKANTAKVDASLSTNPTLHTPGDLETRIPVAGKTDIVTSPVNDALDQLHDYYLKTKDAAGQAQIETLQSKFESQGLTTRELNDLARLHGKDLNAYNANGELASGLTKQAAENTRMGVKNLVRKLTPDDATRALDQNTSDLIATRQMASDMNDKVQMLQNRLQKAGLWRKAANVAATGTDILTGGFFKNLVGLAKSGDQTLNVIQVENNLRKNLALLDRLNTMPPQTAFQTLKSMAPAVTGTAVVAPKSNQGE